MRRDAGEPGSAAEWSRRVLPSSVAELVTDRISARLAPTPLEYTDELSCWLKRDDKGLIPTHKSRGLAIEVALAASRGEPGVVISSSGNAALAMGQWCRELGVRGLAFLSDKTETSKISAIYDTGVATVVTKKPKNFSRYASRYAGLADLRPSRHEHGATGYRLLAAELVEQLEEGPTDLFVFVNSALTLVGVFEGFEALRAQGLVDRLPALHAVQCTSASDLADALGAPVRPQPSPLAGALGAQVPTALERTVEAIRATGGQVWMVLNREIWDERERVRTPTFQPAVESVAALAGYRRARLQGALGDRPVVVVAAPEHKCEVTRAEVLAAVECPESYVEVRAILDGMGLGRADG